MCAFHCDRNSPSRVRPHLVRLRFAGGAGTFTIPGLIKIKTVKKAARPAKKNVPNPFKPGELMDVKAKPESIAVKCLALKKLKDMA